MKSLIRFEEFGNGMGYPSMKNFFNDKPYNEIEKIISYLKKS